MFNYYGRKKKIACLYPPARYGTIIEPFAGAAAYSLLPNHQGKRVLLIERDPAVVEVWEWFRRQTPQQIRALPDIQVGERTTEIPHILMTASKRWWQYKSITVTPVMATNWKLTRRYAARLVPAIRHWEIIQGDDFDAPNLEATWFIDPPYEGEAGTGYRFGSDQLDYTQLADWVKERKGQVIVCEGGGASWLPFRPLVSLVGVAGKSNFEVMYVADAQDHKQLSFAAVGGDPE